MANRWRNNGNGDRLYFLVIQNHCSWWLQPWNWRTLAPWKKSYDQSRQPIKKERHYFADRGPSIQSYGFFQQSGMDCVSWTIKKAERQRIDAFELWCWRRLLRVPWMQGNPTSPSYRKSLLSIHVRTVVEAETPILWPPDTKSWLIWNNPDAGKDWRWEQKGTTEDEMVRWHHWLNGHEFE